MRIYIIALFISTVSFGQYLPHNDGSGSAEKRGDAYYGQMAYVKALAEYESALEKAPRDKGLQLKIAKCYAKLNNQEEVSYYSSQSISDKDASANDVLTYAESLASTQNYEKADAMYSRYGSLNAGDERVELKKEGINAIESLYNDSLGYKVNVAEFNTESAEFGPAFIGDEVFFVSNRGKKKLFARIDLRDETLFLDAYKLSGGSAVKLEDINENLHEGPMADLGNGRIIVTTNYPEPKRNSELGTITKLRMMVYENGAEGWAEVAEFAHNSTAYSVGHPSFDKNSSVLYFASNMPGGKGGVDIYRCEYIDGEWGSPENVSAINTEGDEMFPHISGDDLYFSSNGRGGLGGLDIYTTKVSGGPIYTLGYPVNTSKDDFGIALREDGRTGYFASNREDGLGSDDIYEVVIYKLKVDAKAIDESSGDAVGGTWSIIDSKSGDAAPYVKNGDKATFNALRGRSYTITTDDEYYAESSGTFKVDTKGESYSVNVPLKKTKAPVDIPGAEGSEYIVVKNLANPMAYKLGTKELIAIKESELNDNDKRVIIEDVFFRFNSDEIVSGVAEIDKVIAIMKAYGDVNVELTAYCDARGSDRYNEKLAEKRAQRVEDYIVKNGITADRIESINVGKTELYIDCKKCTEEDHQQNRRVEFSLKVNR